MAKKTPVNLPDIINTAAQEATVKAIITSKKTDPYYRDQSLIDFLAFINLKENRTKHRNSLSDGALYELIIGNPGNRKYLEVLQDKALSFLRVHEDRAQRIVDLAIRNGVLKSYEIEPTADGNHYAIIAETDTQRLKTRELPIIDGEINEATAAQTFLRSFATFMKSPAKSKALEASQINPETLTDAWTKLNSIAAREGLVVAGPEVKQHTSGTGYLRKNRRSLQGPRFRATITIGDTKGQLSIEYNATGKDIDTAKNNAAQKAVDTYEATGSIFSQNDNKQPK